MVLNWLIIQAVALISIQINITNTLTSLFYISRRSRTGDVTGKHLQMNQCSELIFELLRFSDLTCH